MELLVVISIIGVLASLIVGFLGGTSYQKKITVTEAKLRELELGIEDYKASIGFYPPDNKSNTVTNQLFYELTGTHYSYRKRLFISEQGGDGLNLDCWIHQRRRQGDDNLKVDDDLKRQVCRNFFGVDGIQNTTASSKTKSFIELGAKDFALISVRPKVRVLVAPVKWPLSKVEGVDKNGRDLDDYRPIKSNNECFRVLNPWQYRSSGPGRHNLRSFDLWADIPIRGSIHRVGNWRKDPEAFNRVDK